MLRIWSEFLAYDDARSPEVLDLLERHEVHPIFAVRPDSDLDSLDRLLADVGSRGLSTAIWPLLAKHDGYWANEANHQAWRSFAWQVIDELRSRSGQPAWVAVDLEPPIDDVTALLRDVTALGKALTRFARRNIDRDAFARSVAAWSSVLDELHAAGVQTLGVTTPLAAHDLGESAPFWQDLLQTPWADLPFSRHGIMAYNSMIAGYSRGLLSISDARAAHDRLVARTAEAFGASAHVSIGLTGPGVLGDEPAYVDSVPLAKDAGAVRYHGIDDVGLFCLEGLLEQHDPDRWLTRVRSAAAEPVAPTSRARLLRRVGRGIRAVGSLVR